MEPRHILTPFFLDEPLPGLEGLLERGWNLNKPDIPAGSRLERISILHKPIAAFVAETISNSNLPVTITGDCCSAIAVTAGIQRASVDHQLIWFDAHGDFNTWETSPSGFLGGMPLAMLVGRGEQTLLEALAMSPHPEEKVILTDARDLDPLEREAVEGSSVTHLKSVSEILTYALPDLPFHVHFDTDVLNPEIAPAMNYFAEGGPDLEQLKAIFRQLAETNRIIAVSLSSWNPDLDTDGGTQEACMEVFKILIGS